MAVVDVLVYEPNGTTLIARVAGVVEVQVLEELEGVGGGSLKIARANPTWAACPTLLTYRNVVKVRVDSRVVGAFWIKKRENVVVSGGDPEMVQVSGPGLLALLDDAVVYQEFPTSQSGNRRAFNWGSLDRPSGAWRGAVKVRKRGGSDFTDKENPFRKKPANWVDTGDENAWWIWDREKADESAPVGTVYFRQVFTTAADGTLYTLFLTANNGCSVILDGEPLTEIREKRAYKRTYEVDLELDAGTHVLGIAARNRGRFAGMIAALMQYTDADDDEGVVAEMTGAGGWQCLPYPAEPPGWTLGKVLTTLLGEAQTRGVTAVSHLGVGFSGVNDSDGQPWETYSVYVQVGDTYLAVLQEFADYDVQATVDASTMALKAYQHRGADRSAAVFIDVVAHVVSLDDDVEHGMQNALLVTTADSWESHTDSASISAYGRIEGYLDLSQLADKRAAKIAAATIAKSKIPTEGVTVEYVPTSGNVPWLHFWPGDYVSVAKPGGGYKRRKVVSIAVQNDPATDDARYTLELDAISVDQADRLQRLIDKSGMAMGTAAGRSPKKNRGSDPDPAGQPGGNYRRDAVPTFDPGDDPYVPPDDPGWDDEESGFAVGDVSMMMGNEMLAGWRQFGDPLKIILLKSEPTNAAGEWVLGDHELTGDGYIRGEIALDSLTDPAGHDPVMVTTTVDIMCGGNVGSGAWEPITHVAVANEEGNHLLSVVALVEPVTIPEDGTCTFLAGDIQLAVRTV